MRSYPPTQCSGTHTRIWATTSTGWRRPDELLGILEPYGFSGSFTFCLDEPDRAPAFSAANDRTLAYAAADGCSSRSCASISRTGRSRRRSAVSISAPAGSSCIRARRSSRSETSASSRSSQLAAARRVPILIHGGRGLPPIADHLAALVSRYTGTRLIIAHAGIADMAGLAGHFAGVPGVYFDTSVWSGDRPARPLPPGRAGASPVRHRLSVRPAPERVAACTTGHATVRARRDADSRRSRRHRRRHRDRARPSPG